MSSAVQNVSDAGTDSCRRSEERNENDRAGYEFRVSVAEIEGKSSARGDSADDGPSNDVRGRR